MKQEPKFAPNALGISLRDIGIDSEIVFDFENFGRLVRPGHPASRLTGGRLPDAVQNFSGKNVSPDSISGTSTREGTENES
jgi:hypothetical protein